VHATHGFREVGNTQALRRYLTDRALADFRVAGKQPSTDRHAPGLQCFIRYADGRVVETTGGRERTIRPAAKPQLSAGELRTQMEAVRTGIYNRTPAGRARALVAEMERRASELETDRVVAEGRAFFESILGPRG